MDERIADCYEFLRRSSRPGAA